jgi:hypothetical protein
MRSPDTAQRGFFSPRSFGTWLILALILLLYVVTIVMLHPAANFGAMLDDAMYFASAKAIATGHGYMLPSFPGGLARLKYPELYPWLLSWIWRFDPIFPANVVPAIGMTVAFGCWFLVACFLLAKRTLQLDSPWALVVTALCAFNFFGLLLGGSVMSDLPFGALALSAALAADVALEPRGHWGWLALAGALGSLCVGLRTIGVTVVAGIALVALLRRGWRHAALVTAVGGLLSIPWLLPLASRLLGPHPASSALPFGWTQTLAYYSSYVGQWKCFVPNWATQRAVLLKNLFNVILEPGIFLLLPVANRAALLSFGVGSAVALASWAGIFFRFRQGSWKSIHGIFLFYIPFVLPWPFLPLRFLVPFLPLLLGGLVVIVREIAGLALARLRRSAPITDRAAAAAAMAALLALAGITVANCADFVPKALTDSSSQQALLAQEHAAYRWIAAHTAPKARFIANEDALLYLYTGRQTICPIAISTAATYDNDPAIARQDAAHLDDVARFIHADYWLVTSNDFHRQGANRAIFIRRRDELLANAPVVFRSVSGRVRIYDLQPSPRRHRGVAQTPEDRTGKPTKAGPPSAGALRDPELASW